MEEVMNLYVLARRALLDALESLGSHLTAVVLVGAQAVYLRTGEAELAVAPFTTDGDIVLDPACLAEFPPLDQELLRAGFLPRSSESVGAWVTRLSAKPGLNVEVTIDFMVPSSVSPGRGRRALLPGHAPKVARTVSGLDGALVDCDVMILTSLERADSRTFNLRVAGPAALLVAKMFKLKDRAGTGRMNDKDALDVLRLLRGTPTVEMSRRMAVLIDDVRAGESARKGIVLLQEMFDSESAEGVRMAVRAAGPLADPDEIAKSCVLLVRDLMDEIQSQLTSPVPGPS